MPNSAYDYEVFTNKVDRYTLLFLINPRRSPFFKTIYKYSFTHNIHDIDWNSYSVCWQFLVTIRIQVGNEGGIWCCMSSLCQSLIYSEIQVSYNNMGWFISPGRNTYLASVIVTCIGEPIYISDLYIILS